MTGNYILESCLPALIFLPIFMYNLSRENFQSSSEPFQILFPGLESSVKQHIMHLLTYFEVDLFFFSFDTSISHTLEMERGKAHIEYQKKVIPRKERIERICKGWGFFTAPSVYASPLWPI